MLALLPLILSMAPEIARWIGGDQAAVITTKAAGVVEAITGTSDPDAAAAVLQDPTKAAELRIALAKIAADAEGAKAQADLDRLKATLSDAADARARDAALQAGGKRNSRADVMVALTIVGIGGGLAFLMIGGFTPGSSVEGAVLGLIGLLSGCFKDAFAFEFGSSRGSMDKSAANERLTAAVLDQRQAAAPAIINQPSGTVNTGSTDDLNAASLRAARQ